MTNLTARLNHGFGSPVTYLPGGGISTAPRFTESVPARIAPLWWQERGLQFTATGYGARIPSRYMVKYNGRWRRVYVACFSNSGSAYIGKSLASGIPVDIEESE